MPTIIPPRNSLATADKRKKIKNPGMGYVEIEKNKKIMKILREADSNNDGRYNKDELKNALKHLGAILPAGWRANRCLLKADADNDGEISGDEIDTLLEYLCSRGFGK